MMKCDKSNLVQRLHDNEVSAAERAAAESHLRECAECRQLLADLRQVSQLIAEAATAVIPDEAVQRMQEVWHAARERSVRRAAGWLTATAAAVLVAALLTSPTGTAESGDQLPIWQTVAVSPSVGEQDDVSEALVTARWMADDLRFSETR